MSAELWRDVEKKADENYWMERAQRAEAHVERLQDAASGVISAVDELQRVFPEPDATPPPEGEPYLLNRADGVDGHYTIARKHPNGYSEFWAGNHWSSAGMVINLNSTDPAPTDPTGDALAAWRVVSEAAHEYAINCREDEQAEIDGYAGLLKDYITASGVPDEAVLNQAYLSVAGLAASAMGVSSMSKAEASEHAGYVRDALDASGMPYVPNEVRRLPDRMDREADARDDGDFISDHARGIADASRRWAELLREALASAPAVPEELERPCWEKGVSEHAYVKGWNDCREAMIAAAPSDGGHDD